MLFCRIVSERYELVTRHVSMPETGESEAKKMSWIWCFERLASPQTQAREGEIRPDAKTDATRNSEVIMQKIVLSK